MPKKLKKPGKNISANKNKSKLAAEIQNISNQGIWILVNTKEFYMPFTKFPWFLKATIEQIYDVELFHEHHLHWPALDIDIDIESLKNLEQYPLKFS